MSRALRPDRPGGRRGLTVTGVLAIVGLLAACGGSTPPGSSPPATDRPSPTGLPSPAPTPAPTPEPSLDTPPAETPVAETPSSAPSPSEEPTSPDPSDEPGAADACAGNENNRDFYVTVAQSVDWTVVCPVLPAGWFVDTGSWRLAGGGRLTISYKGPAGARLEIGEGAFCQEAAGCVGDGADLGRAPLGPLEGTLVGLDGGGFAVVVDRGAAISWQVVALGVEQGEAASIAAAFVEVAA